MGVHFEGQTHIHGHKELWKQDFMSCLHWVTGYSHSVHHQMCEEVVSQALWRFRVFILVPKEKCQMLLMAVWGLSMTGRWIFGHEGIKW